MFSAKIAIRLPSSFMCAPLSGLLRRLGEERPHERAHRAAAAAGARGLPILPLADGHGHGDFFLALVAIELVERHGHSSSHAGAQPRLTTTDFTSVYSSMPSWPPSRPTPDSLNPPNGLSWVSPAASLAPPTPSSTGWTTRT